MKKGQIVLFVIVLLTIALIIISSAVTRTLTGIKNNNINTDSTRAFNAAESGIDELLKRSDLASLAVGAVQNTSSVDRSSFTEASYKIENSDPGYFGLISKDTILQIEFNSDPTNLKINYSSNSCLEVSFYNSANQVSRQIICGDPGLGLNAADATNNGYGCDMNSFPIGYSTECKTFIGVPVGLKLMLVKVLVEDSQIKISSGVNGNYGAEFKTKPIKATAWATTKSGVKKEVQVITKTTNDIFPVFDNALYIR